MWARWVQGFSDITNTLSGQLREENWKKNIYIFWYQQPCEGCGDVAPQHPSMASLPWASWWQRKAGDRSDVHFVHTTFSKGFGENVNPIQGEGGALRLSWASPPPAAPLHGDFWCHPTTLWGVVSCPSTQELPQHHTNRYKGVKSTSCQATGWSPSPWATNILPTARKAQQKASLKAAFLPKALDHSLGSLLFHHHLLSISFQGINEV